MENNLLSRIITGEANEEEKKEFYLSLSENKEEEELFFKVKSLWIRASMQNTKMDVDVEYCNLREKISGSREKRSFRFWNSLMKYAALALFILGIGGLLGYQISKGSFAKDQLLTDNKENTTISQEISTNFGARMKFQLSDGTTVHLNSGSKLVFPSKFLGHTRKVELIGEAFFEVAPNPSNPFIVKTRAFNVKVLGTSFNLKAFPELNEISTTLVSGSVILETEEAGVSSQIASLMPSDRAVYNSKSKRIQISKQLDLDKFIAWKEGKLVFSNDPIDELAEKLGTWYNVTVKIGNPALGKHRFTATFTDEPIEQVLDLLSKSAPLKYKIVSASKLKDDSYSKRQIVLN